MEAEARELVGRDIVPHVAGVCALDQQDSDHVGETPFRSDDLLNSMQDHRELGVVLPVGFVGYEA
ncbi:MAG: hypothetical protein ABI466_07200 [Chloroflexota bacterium]